MIVYFVSSNAQKHKDVARLFRDSESPPRSLEQRLVEVLSSDLETVVKEKAKAAYKQALVPLIVEHGALYIDHLSGLPGPMVKLFWEKLDDRLPSLLPAAASRRAEAVHMVCSCDGKRLRVYKGRVRGSIAAQKRGSGGIHWEPMFIPEGHQKTLGEMRADERLSAHSATLAYKALRKDLGI
jgi:XTP/dITP diphosphohydrolase